MSHKTILGSVAVACLALTMPAQAQAQSSSELSVKNRMQASPVQAQRRQDRRRSFVKRQHRQLKCGKGEKKQLIIKGVEDNFLANGGEQASKSLRVQTQTHTPAWNQGVGNTFDGTSVNRKIFSFLDLPNNVTRGKFMIGLRTIGEQVRTDGMAIGNLGDISSTVISPERAGFSYASGAWTGTTGPSLTPNGNNYSADFNNIRFVSGSTLKDAVNNGETTIDVYVQDDHSVDYVAASVCSGPEKKGMTWGIRNPQPEPVNGVAHVGCNYADGGKCDPYQGDTVCSKELPILCLNPLRLQKPQNLTEDKWDKWSGGIIGTTNPTAAPSTLAQANAMCTAEFGPGWRVAEHHDAYPGSSGWRFSAYGNVGTKGKRFWTDIRNQPNGICWTR